MRHLPNLNEKLGPMSHCETLFGGYRDQQVGIVAVRRSRPV